MRYAAYLRISSEDQIGNFSIFAQHRAIEAWIRARDSEITKVYVDEGLSGRTADRPAFQEMRSDAHKGKFDAIVVHKFDRFARNRIDALAIKSLLRKDYGIKVYSVSEPSEDSDGAFGAMIEGLMECVADWYSVNLAAETVKGKKERAVQGYHNNRPPFGMDKNADGILVANEHELVGLRNAFTLYATGKYSDNDIAHILTGDGFVSKTGKPFSTDTVRDMLQNRTYLGYVRYQPYQRHSDGRRSWAIGPEWFKGLHEAVIDESLFEKCQQARAARTSSHDYRPHFRVYLLQDIVYCAECEANKPDGLDDDEYGKMRSQSIHSLMYYRCRARDLGRKCSQAYIRADAIEPQVIEFLKAFKLPADWQLTMQMAMGERMSKQNLDERVAQTKAIIQRMDFRLDNGFITDMDAYIEQRAKLQQELEQLHPLANDELEIATDILEHFNEYWEKTGSDRKQQKELLQLLVSRVWIRDNRVTAITLHPNYHITLE